MQFFPLIICLLLSVQVHAADPMEVVQNTVNDVVKILKDETLDREGRWQSIGEIINRRFDFQTMSQSVLATNWQSATPSEKRQFVEFFSQYLEDTYRTKIESYSDQRIEFVDEVIQGQRATVDSIIHTSSTEIPVRYKLINKQGDWFAYDVVIEGISLVSNYRSTYAAIVKNEGMEGLLADLKSRIDRHKAARADGITAEQDASQ